VRARALLRWRACRDEGREDLPRRRDHAVIDQYGNGGLRDWLYGDTEKSFLDGKGTQLTSSDLIDGIEYWGQCDGKLLTEWGVKGVKEGESYDITAILIGNHVIRAALNPDPLGQRPYASASFDEVPGTIWGTCPPELMRDLQQLCNGAARAREQHGDGVWSARGDHGGPTR
jgi:hypothetical protein